MSALTEGRLKEPGREVGVHIATFLHPGRDENLIPSLLAKLRASAGDYVPDSFHIDLLDEGQNVRRGPKVPLTNENMTELVRALQSPVPGLPRLTRGVLPDMTIYLWTLYRTGIPYEPFSLFARRELVSSPIARERFLSAAHIFLDAFGGFFGDLGTAQLMMIQDDERYGRRLVASNLGNGLPPPRWGFLLGSDYVRLLGGDRLTHAPCDFVHEYSDGCFLLLLTEDYEELERDLRVLEERRRRLVDYLGPEYFSYVESGAQKKVLPRFARDARSPEER